MTMDAAEPDTGAALGGPPCRGAQADHATGGPLGPDSPCATSLSPVSSESSATSSQCKKGDGKKCGVCGDRALGYNFNAITCESCKAFFRRNALKKKEFRCPFNGNCTVDVVTRRFCQKCRIKKCFEIGMKKEWIMSEEEKQKKKQKIEENRVRKMTECSREESSAASSSGAFSKPVNEAVKPQAVDGGTVREDDEPLPKVQRLECHTDHRHQEEGRFENSMSPPQPSQSSDIQGSFVVDHDFCESSRDDRLGDHYSVDCVDTSSSLQPSAVDLSSPDSSYSPSKGSQCTSQILYHMVSDTPTPLKIATSPYFSPSVNTSSEEVIVKQEYMPCNEAVPRHSSPDPALMASSSARNDLSITESLEVIHSGFSPVWPESSGTSMMDSLVNTAIAAEYSGCQLVSCRDPLTLNEIEKQKLAELFEANKGMMAPLIEDEKFKDVKNYSLLNVINLTDIAIRRIIKMSKKINTFKNLCQDDQIALLKGGCTEIMVLRSVYAWDPEKDSWKIKKDHENFKNIKLDVLQSASGNIYEAHKNFLRSFKPEWRQDQAINLLLTAVTLFTPERPNVIHCSAIKHEQCCYLHLLKRYLDCTYGSCEGPDVYYSLLKNLNHLHMLNEDHMRVFLEVNPRDVEPLLIEIFDLKYRSWTQ